MFTIRESGSNNYKRSLISDYVQPVVAGCVEQCDHPSPGFTWGYARFDLPRQIVFGTIYFQKRG
jgi:hypothetical protein